MTRLPNLYGIFTMDNRGNSDVDGFRPWKLQSDITFHKRVIQEGWVICTEEFVNVTDKYLDEAIRVLTADYQLDLVLDYVKHKPEVNFYVCGDSSLFEALKDYISKWYVTFINLPDEAIVESSSSYIPGPVGDAINFYSPILDRGWSEKLIYELEKPNSTNEFTFKIFKYEYDTTPLVTILP